MNRSTILSFVVVATGIAALLATSAHSQLGTPKNYVSLQPNTPGTSQSGHINVSGSILAAQHIGGGAGLTGVNADLFDGINSTQFGQLSGANSWTGVNSFSNSGNSYVGNGSGLASLNASALASGNVPSARVSGNLSLITGLGTITSGTWLGTTIAPSVGGTGINTSTTIAGSLLVKGNAGLWTTLGPGLPNQVLKISGSTPTWGLDETGGTGTVTSLSQGTGIDLSPDTITTAGTISIDTNAVPLLSSANLFSGANNFSNGANQFSGTFTGNGSGIAQINATNISSGTLADARLTANVARRDAGNIFNGSNLMAAGTQMFFDSGTVNDPGIAFASDADTGIFRPSANQLAFAAGGTEVGRLDIDGFKSGGVGAASAPSYSWLSDPDTGIYSPIVDTIAFTTAGIGRMIIAPNGRVGIGTASPGFDLEVAGQGLFEWQNQSQTDATFSVHNGTTSLAWNPDGSHALRGQAEAVGSGYAIGVEGIAQTGNVGSRVAYGVYGVAMSDNLQTNFVYGVFGQSFTGDPNVYAGYFAGRLAASTKLFQIDHPLDPENRYLNHSCVESDEMKNVYDGIAICDKNGEVWVEMPNWFEALNRQFRYQLTCIGGYSQVYVANKLNQGRFRIGGGKPGLEVSWQVTGVRKDPYAEANPLQVDQPKPASAIGKYLHPEVYGMPHSYSIHPRPTVVDKSNKK